MNRKNVESFTDPWDTIKCTNICVKDVSEEKREREAEKIFEERMTPPNFF